MSGYYVGQQVGIYESLVGEITAHVTISRIDDMIITSDGKEWPTTGVISFVASQNSDCDLKASRRLLAVDDLIHQPYGAMIIALKGERYDWLSSISDRAAFSVIREGFNSLLELRKAVSGGYLISKIPNLGAKEVAEVEALVSLTGVVALGRGRAPQHDVLVRWYLTEEGHKVGFFSIKFEHSTYQMGEYWIRKNGDVIINESEISQLNNWVTRYSI
jgi:hypothetical protein